ncbi:right-handed parallel beta-helix repeat-containing protein [Streptomyces sp. NPDC019396]|uniref:right-handed parallel beta-helix repeat-containing protein n=1 Tax=Streptomyces sp. NPDC019396 TaxID=3154687 RepID=UPI0033CEE373
MPDSQGAPSRPKTATLSRHWNLAVLAAAGFATAIGTTATSEAVAHPKAEAAPAIPVGSGAPGGASPKGDEDTGEAEGHDDRGNHDKESKGNHGKGGHGDRSDHDEFSGHHYGEATRYVECDPNDLVAVLADLNSERGGEVVLAKDCTYTLTSNLDGNGLPEITQPISIRGNGATIQRAANADQFRLFEVGTGGDLKLRHLTLTRGTTAPGEDGAAVNVHASGRLDLDHVTITRNSVDNPENNEDAGGIYNEGVTTIRNSTLSKNTGQDAPALLSFGGKVEITGSKITGNVSDPTGYAALYNELGTLTIKKSLVSYNYAYTGGGLYNYSGTSRVEQSVFEYNHGDYGAGIGHGEGTLTVRDSTVAYNTAISGGGGGLHLGDSAALENTKIYGNVATDSDGGGAYVSTGDDAPVVFRDSKIHDNQAPGNGFSGGGIYVDSGTVNLTDTKVTGNISDEPAGGVHNLGTVTTNGKVRIVDNVPTNCQATGTNTVPNCFG